DALMRRWLPITLVLALVPSVASAEVPRFGDLPEGHVTTPPVATPPASIPAHEKVPGFFVVTPDQGRRLKGSRGGRLDYVLVVASKERAMRLGEGDYNRRKTDPDTCLS